MNILVSSSYSQHLNQIRESFHQHLDNQHKQIFLIVSAALAAFVLCFVVWRCYLHGKKVQRLPAKQGQETVPASVTEVIKKKEPAEDKKAQETPPAAIKEIKSAEITNTPSPKPNALVETKEESTDLPIEKSAEGQETLKTADLPTEELSEEEHELPEAVNLLFWRTFFQGEVRKSKRSGKEPALNGLAQQDISTIYDQQLWTTAFAACFHTEESHEEIHDLLLNIRKKMGDLSIDSGNEDHPYICSFSHLYENLATLHEALLGNPTQKEAKIYWSKSVEEELIPHLFEGVLNLNETLFIVTRGALAATPFQASMMYEDLQLQFISLDRDKAMQPIAEDITTLEEDVLGATLSNDAMGEATRDLLGGEYCRKLENHAFTNRVFNDTFLIREYLNLQSLKAKNAKIDFTGGTIDENVDNIVQLFSTPSKPKKYRNLVEEQIKAVETKESPEEEAPISWPSLISYFGKVRKSHAAGNPPPDLEFDEVTDNTIVQDQLWTTAFAACFHTAESHQEIHQLIMRIRKKMGDNPEDPYFIDSFVNLYHNLMRLYDDLPGEPTQKVAKIYWNQAAEEKLMPYLFSDGIFVADKMQFIVTSGELANTHFLTSKMLPNLQLQFFALDWGKARESLEEQSQDLLREFMGTYDPSEKVLVEEVGNSIFSRDVTETTRSNKLFGQAQWTLLCTYIYLNLQSLKAKGKQLDIENRPHHEQIEILREIYSSPSNPKKYIN